ncbi:MAG: hypothetical protein KDA60_10695, partial [Planctomycetales bacterium]|nr:hypothetical protein [Planctomycetales bacterium]
FFVLFVSFLVPFECAAIVPFPQPGVAGERRERLQKKRRTMTRPALSDDPDCWPVNLVQETDQFLAAAGLL